MPSSQDEHTWVQRPEANISVLLGSLFVSRQVALAIRGVHLIEEMASPKDARRGGERS